MSKIKTKYPDNLINDVFGCEIKEPRPFDTSGTVEYLIWSLSPRENEIIHLRYRDGKTYAEIGAIVGVSRSRIEQLCHRALRKLRSPRNVKYLKLGIVGAVNDAVLTAEDNVRDELKAEFDVRLRSLQEEMSKIYGEGIKAPSTAIANAPKCFSIIRTNARIEQLRDMPITDMGLSARVTNALGRSGRITLGDIVAMKRRDLMRLRNFGEKCLNELIDKLEELEIVPQFSDKYEMLKNSTVIKKSEGDTPAT